MSTRPSFCLELLPCPSVSLLPSPVPASFSLPPSLTSGTSLPMVTQMEAEDVANEVRQYSILVGFLLIIIFVVPCVGFALFSKYCQKQTRRKRVSGNTWIVSLIQCTLLSVHMYMYSNPFLGRDICNDSDITG